MEKMLNVPIVSAANKHVYWFVWEHTAQQAILRI